MTRSFAMWLQAVILLVAIAAFVFLLGEPHLEGRNAQATVFEVYFKDPFLAYVYVGSIPFFVALYRAFGLAGHASTNDWFSQTTVDQLRSIKHCLMLFVGFVAGAAVLMLLFGDSEDRPAATFMILLAAVPAIVSGVAVAILARNLQHALRRS